MFRFDQWWMPDGETHLVELMGKTQRRVDGRLTYQHHKYARALGFCRQFRAAVDVGAHVGLWSYWMAEWFRVLHAFEPSERHRECWVRNVTTPTAHLYPYALGASAQQVGLCVATASSGNTRIAAGDTVPMRTLVVGFAATVMLTAPLPLPLAPPVTVIHGALLTAVHQQPLEAVTVIELFVAAAVADWAVVDNE